MFLKLIRQVVRSVEPEDLSNFSDGLGGIREKVLSLLETNLELILLRTQTSLSLEDLAKGRVTDMQFASQVFYDYRLMVAPRDE